MSSKSIRNQTSFSQLLCLSAAIVLLQPNNVYADSPYSNTTLKLKRLDSSNSPANPSFPGILNPYVQNAIMYAGMKIYEAKAFATSVTSAEVISKRNGQYYDTLVLFNTGRISLQEMSQEVINYTDYLKDQHDYTIVMSKYPKYAQCISEAITEAKKILLLQ